VLVDRVLLAGTRAMGVRTASGDDIGASAVILSAGAIHSPAILLRSGIGTDGALPVGRGLRDHAATPGFELPLHPEARTTTTRAPVFNALLRYTSGLAGAGPNDMQMVWFDAVGNIDEARSGGRLIGAVMRVFSHGEIRLRSADPTEDPIVEFRMLSDERDLARLRDCVRRMIAVVRHPSVAGITDGVLALTTPLEDLDSDAEIDAWLLAHVTDYVHAACSCRMGTPGDPHAVVDTRCRVLGYDGLLVCDASVMPDLPKANTHLTTVAIAHRLAELLG
jgi:choline dehydrogenase-like flavoprotein